MAKRKFPRSSSFDPDTLVFDDLRSSGRQTNYVTKNAVGYCRISSDIQARDSHWLEAQYGACKEYASQNWMNILSFFQDEAISWSIMDRRGLKEAEDYVKKKNKTPWEQNIKYLLCTEISRLSRPEFVYEGIEIISRFLRLWLTIIDVFSWQTINRENDMEMILAVLKMSQAKSERENIINRTKNWAMQRLKQWYRAFPNVPTWYKYIKKEINWKRNSIVIRDEPNASKLAEWLRLYAEWVLYNKIDLVNYLREVSVLTNKTKNVANEKMRYTVVYSLLKPERLLFYAWKIVSPRCWIVEPVDAKHEPLISQEIFQKLMRRIQKPLERKPFESIYIEDFPLRTILKCKTCWNNMYWSFVVGKSGRKFPYYECKNSKCALKTQWISRSCNMKQVHKELRLLLESFIIPNKEKDLIREISKRILKEKDKIQQTIFDEKKQQIKKIETEMEIIKKTMMSLREPTLIVEYEKEWTNLNNNKCQIEEDILSLKMWDVQEKFYEHLENTLFVFDNLLNIWDNNNTEIKQLLLKVIFEWKLFYNKKEGLRTPFYLVENWRFFVSDSSFFLNQLTRECFTNFLTRFILNWSRKKMLSILFLPNLDIRQNLTKS